MMELEAAAQTAPAAARNREPILQVLREWLPGQGLVLEVASGTGEHAVWFSSELPGIMWQPTECAADRLASIDAWRATGDVPNLLAPLPLDAAVPVGWPVARADAVVAINMIHIAPWQAMEGLMAGAARVLSFGAVLYLYGPFREGCVHTAESNAAFDADLQARDPAWGVRDLADVVALAQRHGFDLAARRSMPANNLSVLFRRR